ncbi:MAG: hypothetical protein R2864_05155 [Syntrophotaleaceae bacterium]
MKAGWRFDNPGLELKPDMYVNVAHPRPKKFKTLPYRVRRIHSVRNGIRRSRWYLEPREVKTGVQDQKGFIE